MFSTLKCGHTFCSSCMIGLLKIREIQCPFCKFITLFPNNVNSNNVLDYLVGNFTLLEALNVFVNEDLFKMPNNEMCIQMSDLYNLRYEIYKHIIEIDSIKDK